MKNCLSRRLGVLPAALCAAFSVSSPLLAQTPAPSRAVALKETVVTATRSEQPLSDVLADISVIDRATLERSGAGGLADVLARIPGVEIARTGGPGSNTGIFVRGAEGRFTAVFIDGVRVDSQSTGGATWESIPLAQIDRVEVLRGPAAAVYGSDALGGVIQIFTRRGEGAFAPTLGVGIGRYGTRKLDAGVSGTSGAVDYALGLADEKSQGYNSRTAPTQNPDRDGYSSQSGSARIGLQVNAVHRLEASALSHQLDSQYDSSTRFVDEHNAYRLTSAALQWQAKWTDRYSTRVSLTESQNRYESRPSPYLTLTRVRGALVQNELTIGAHRLTGALEQRVDQLDNTPTSQSRSQNGLALGYGFKQDVHAVQLNARRDQDSEFGGKTTGSAAYALALAPRWRATASAGTAYRAPTLYQRFSAYGLASLQPESSRNMELGVRFAEGTSHFSAVGYRNTVSNLISFVSAPGPCAAGSGAFPGCFGNTARARYTGVTLAAGHRLGTALGPVDVRGSVDVQDPRDLDTGKLLARRSRQHALLGADWRVGSWLLGAESQWSGVRYSSPGEALYLPGYGLLNLNASTRVARDWTALARLDNATAKHYETVSGYATPGRSLYLALKWAPQ